MAKTKKIIILILTVLLLFSSCCFSVFAAEYSYVSVPYTKPQINVRNMFIELLFQDTTGGDFNGVLLSFDVNSDFNIDDIRYDVIISSTAVKINAVIPQNLVAQITSLKINTQGNYAYDSKLYFHDSEADWYFSFLNDSTYNKIIGYNIYGNYGTIETSCEKRSFVMNYGTDNVTNSQLQKIINSLGELGSISGNINSFADKITDNQNENTDKIIENQNDLQNKEKQEAQQQGNESVDEVSDAIDDKSSGFIGALGGLVSSMSYDGTECAWTFPAIKIPKIDGVMDEIQLTEEQPIDFAYWVQKMPPDILKVVRAVLTIGLIVYCFKELYNTISYALTLSGGNSTNE